MWVNNLVYVMCGRVWGTALVSSRPRSAIFNRTKCHKMCVRSTRIMRMNAAVAAAASVHSKALGPDPPPAYTRAPASIRPAQCYTFCENKRNYYYASNINRRLSSAASR